jgi:PAS domain S-box-containing protein
VMLLMDDVTEQVRLGEEVRRAERHLASVVESASEIIVSTDVEGRVLTWNTAAERVAGFREADVQGRPLRDLCRKAHAATMSKILKRLPSQGRTGPVEVELIDSRGKAVPISWVASSMRDAAGKIVGWVIVGRDLTERRRFEAQLLRSEKLAALGVMAGGIAHEIRNPLAVVSSAAQLLLESPNSRKIQRECAEKIHQAAFRASSIIERLLRFARASDKVEMTSLNVVHVVEDALALVANQLHLRKVHLHKRFPDAAMAIRGNVGLLQQLITNLMLNAAEAMPKKGGLIEVSLEEGNGQVQLRVVDNGKGIRQTDLPKVFDPFFTRMPVGKGTGLGLSICYAIVRQHEGTIDVTSRRRSGTTVTVIFPLSRERRSA